MQVFSGDSMPLFNMIWRLLLKRISGQFFLNWPFDSLISIELVRI